MKLNICEQIMTEERLNWLELSPPRPPKKTVPAATGKPPCPTCGWPVSPQVEACPHCGHRLIGHARENIVAELGIKLPSPVIKLLPAPARWFKGHSPASTALYQLRLQAEQLRVTTGFDRLICLDDISVDHYRHQLEAALRALRDMRGRALLADEVGLGKTIEAGIVMKELVERGLANSILILTPASLTWQWHEEMHAKFHEDFTVLEQHKQLPTPINQRTSRWIISLDRAKSPYWSKKLLSREYDLLIVDEAHKLKNHRTKAYKFVNQIRKQYVLMLTATPIHNNLLELYNLVTILRPGHLGTRRAFKQNFSRPAKHRAPVRTIYSTATPNEYLRKSRPARQAYRQTSQAAGIRTLTENFADLESLKLNAKSRQAVQEIRQLQQQGYEVFDFEAIDSGYWHANQFVCRLKLNIDNAPPPTPRHITPRNPAALRHLLQELMIRNRRSQVSVRFPPRRAAIYALNLTPPERQLYDIVTAYIREQLHTPPDSNHRRPVGAQRMALMMLQKQVCSSPQAAARALRTLTNRYPNDPRLAKALVLAIGIDQGRKVTATLQLLAEYPGKFLIFTDYLPTLEALTEALTRAGHKTVTFHGGMSTLERVEAVRQFRHSARVMVSTQSGSEGHNLQFCHQLINFDLPWNPMRIEQRVGRLHRLGQKEAVSIFNLSANNTIEAYVLDLLARKIHMFEMVVGELDMILGQLDEQRSFERRVEDAWADSKSEAELLQMIADLETMLGKAQATYQSVRSASDELSDLLDDMDEVEALGL